MLEQRTTTTRDYFDSETDRLQALRQRGVAEMVSLRIWDTATISVLIRCSNEHGACALGINEIARTAKACRRTAFRALARLEQRRVYTLSDGARHSFQLVQRGRRPDVETNIYQLNTDALEYAANCAHALAVSSD